MANYTDPIGAVLLFGDDLIEKLDKIDKNFAKIEKSSNKLSESISKMAQSFDAAMNGIGNFADKPSQSLSSFDKMVSSTIGNVSTLTETLNRAGDAIKSMYSQTNGNGASSQILAPIDEAIEKEEKNFEFYKGYLDDLRKTYSDLGKKGSFPIIDWKDLDYLSEALDKTMEKLLALQNAREQLKSLTDTRKTERYETSFEEERRNAELKLLNDQYRRGVSLLQQQAKEEDEIKKREEETARQREKEEEQRLRRFNERIKQRAAEESSAENEIMRKLKERLSIEEKIQTLELKGAKTEEEGRLLEEYKRKTAELSAEIENLSKKYQKVGDKAKSAFASQELESLVRRQKEAAQAQEKLNIEQARENPNFAIEKARQAKSIADLRNSLVLLRAALENVDISTKQGKKTAEQLTQAIRYQEGEVDRLTNKTQKLHSAHRELIDVGGQLKGMFMSVFSLYQVTGFIKKMVQVRGEFELQHRALQAIIQDLDKADKLWSQITELAVESPFRVKELVTYTKQLAAYRIETDKIFDVTKRLADVSAGLGVDMNRLILAYGQVKAANYLRGQELRQFSEAGINILGELAAQFSEVEGVAISTGEVFDRVSKRMVKFEDVARVFERLTDEGGIFYEMQEKQAETLQGRISNLKDSLDLMYDDIGKANSGVLKDSVGYLKELIDNWRGWMPFAIAGLTALITKWLAMKVTMAIINKSFTNLIANMALGLKYFTNTFSKLGQDVNKLNNALTQGAAGAAGAGAWGAAISALAATITIVIGLIQKARREMKELNKIQDEGAAEGYRMTTMFRKLASEATDASKSFTEQQSAVSKLKNAFGDILPAEKLQIDYLKSLKGNYDELTESILKNVEAKTLEKKVDFIQEEYSKKLGKDRDALKSGVEQVLKANKLGYDRKDIKILVTQIEKDIRSGKIATVQDIDNALNELIAKYFGLKGGDYTSTLRSQSYSTKYSDASRAILKDMAEMNEKIKDLEDEVDANNPFTLIRQYNRDREKAEKEFNDFSNYLNDYVTTTGEAFDKAKAKMEEYMAKYTQLGELPEAKDLNPILLDELKTNFQIAQLGTLRTKYEDVVEVTNSLDGELRKLYSTDKQEAIKAFVLQNASAFKIGTDEMKDYLLRAGESSDELVRRLKELREENKKNIEGFAEGTSPFWFDEKQKELAILHNQFIDKELTFMDRAPKDNDTTGRGNDLMEKRIELIRKMNAEYEKLRENFNEDDAVVKVTQSYTDAWNEIMKGTGLSMTQFFKTKETTAEMLEKLRPFAKKTTQALERAIGDTKVVIETDVRVKNRDEFKNELDNLFEGYNLWQELDKMGVPPSLAQELFDVQATSLDKIADYIKEKKEDLTGTLGEEAVREALEKIHKMEQEQNITNLKEYVKYLHEAMNERVKIQSETIRKISNINKLAENEQISDDTRNLMIKGAKEEEQKELNRLLWENFKSTDVYVKMFEDLDKQSTASLRHMREQLESLKDKMGEDPIQVKAITEQMEKLDKVILNRNPFTKGVQNLFSTVEQLRKEGKDEASLIEQLIGGTADEQRLQDYADILQLAIDAKASPGKLDLIDKDLLDAAKTYLVNIDAEAWSGETSLEKMLEEFKKLLKAKREDNELMRKNLNDWERARQSAEAMARTIEDWSHQLQSLGSDVFELIQSFGGAASEEAKALKETVDSLMDVGTSIINLAVGIGSGDPVKIVQGTVGAMSSLIKMVTKLNQLHDARLTDRIDAWEKKVSELSHSYEKLQQAMDRAYALDELNTSSQAMLSNINAQIAAYERMRSAELAKKKSDEDAVRDYNRSIEELTEKADEVADNLRTSLGGIGVSEYVSQAESFADAWLSAFNETGDGLDALNDKWDDVVNNMVKKQLLSRVTKQFLDPLFNLVNSSIDDGILSKEELDMLKSIGGSTMQKLNETYKSLLDSIGFLSSGDVSLSGLQEGIQGMTEQTAEVLAAYANSLRLIQSQQLAAIQDLAARVLSSDGAANPVLAELRRQTSYLDNIHSLLNSIIERGSAGGRALRIVS